MGSFLKLKTNTELSKFNITKTIKIVIEYLGLRRYIINL